MQTSDRPTGFIDHKRRYAILAMGALIASGSLIHRAARADDSASPTASEPGVWQQHQYSFAYMGFTSTYSCDGLASKLKLLLIASGARPDAKSNAGACASTFGRPDKFARADLSFFTLTPASGSASDGQPVNGTWRPVSLTAHKPRDLGTGDCELVEQFKSNVLPMFTTRNIESHTTCVPHQLSGSTINLKFESFSAPPPPRGKRQAPPSPGH